MLVRSASKRRGIVAAAVAAVVGSPATGDIVLRYDQAFATAAAPTHFHARIAYRGRDGVHRMELWRNGAIRLRRDTDARLVTIARRQSPRSPEFRLDLLDRRRLLHTIIDRNSLYQVGHFADWEDLALAMRRPAGRYRLTALALPPTSTARPAAPCRWFGLQEEGRRTQICWSREQAFPMLMLDGNGQEIWRVATFDQHKPAASLFRPDDKGYIVNNAARDITGD
jgi:hypothetical protein